MSRQGRYPDIIIYPGAATKTGIMACVVVHMGDSLRPPRIRIARWAKARPDWLIIFNDANLICGLETLSLALTIADPDLPIDDSLITCYVDNNNTVRPSTFGLRHHHHFGLIPDFWAICAARGIVPWLEWVDSDLVISDLPTREEELPINFQPTGRFRLWRFYLEWLKKAQSRN